MQYLRWSLSFVPNLLFMYTKSFTIMRCLSRQQIVITGLLCFILTISAARTLAQYGPYWVVFKDKGFIDKQKQYVSDKTISTRVALGLELYQYSDVPPCQAYIDTVAAYGIVHGRSRWFNAVAIYMDETAAARVRSLRFVSRVDVLYTSMSLAGVGQQHPAVNGAALVQIGAEALHREALSGKNVIIGIIDGNFQNAGEEPLLSHVFTSGRVAGTWDFVTRSPIDFSAKNDSITDNHGTLVWQMIAGKGNDETCGAGVDASFYLARTDVTEKEFRGEEVFWISALEWMDSLGVRLVNSSVGYSIGFDDPTQDHRVTEMNGKGMLARAVQIAAEEKGMIVVLAAGNGGNTKQWEINSTPADAQGAITVGSTDETGLKLPHSAIGSPYVSYLKPNVVCFSAAGTSFSAPVITGLVACMLQKQPDISNREVVRIIEQSGHLFPYGNNYLGYGIPDAARIIELMNGNALQGNNVEEMHASGNKVSFKTAALNNEIVVVFHKNIEHTVLFQEYLMPDRKNIVINRPRGGNRSTVVAGTRRIEICWQQ